MTGACLGMTIAAALWVATPPLRRVRDFEKVSNIGYRLRELKGKQHRLLGLKKKVRSFMISCGDRDYCPTGVGFESLTFYYMGV